MERKLAAILAADVVGFSRLMERDETGTLAALKAHRGELIEPQITEHHGRVVKLMGDGTLAEFASVVDAVACAIAIQRGMAARNADVADERRIALRVGVHLGDVIVEGDDIYGDGVNVAARLERLAEPGGLCLSRQAYDQVDTKLELAVEDLGDQQVKNLARPVRVFRVALDGAAPAAEAAAPAAEQEIHTCTTPDGVRLAYAVTGQGPPLVKAANWMSHLVYDWQSPVWRHILEALSRDHLLVRYDERGTGLSDWDVEDLGFESMVCDMETVVDDLGLERFALLGLSQGCAVSIAYAIRHPERVSHLVLHGGYARGWRRRASPGEIERRQAMMTLTREGWGQDNPAFRQIFSTLYMPEGSEAQIRWFNELQRVSASPQNAVKLQESFGDIDVMELLHRVRIPTLVMHSRLEAAVPFAEGEQMAMAIPGARFVPLDSKNHLILEHEAAWPVFLGEIRRFLGSG